ncbi:MAG: hypothetical protein HFH14_10175 [Lachnospiraceae bacterium]|nr:hypothetical protein [Lachnospiraceae bacterium]
MSYYKKIIISVCCILSLAVSLFAPLQKNIVSADLDKPIVTFACLSDLHNQGPIITNDNSNIRGTISDTIDGMKYDEENVDFVVVGGDVSSDNQTSESKMYRILDMVQDKLTELTPKTMWITGNHDYNAGESSYNSADYYNRYTQPTMGEVADENDIYIENYKGIDYICSYHYKVNDIDFICMSNSYEILEGGKQHYNYTYSDGAYEWLEDMLFSIGTEKPVFIIGHFPFRDSNSLSSPDKGLLEESGRKLKAILSGYPNAFYLYGHDHATDTAYIRTDTAQRVTEYDEFGNVLNAPKQDDSDPEESQHVNDTIVWKFTPLDGGYIVTNTANGRNLDVGVNLTTSDDRVIWNVTEDGGVVTITKADDAAGNGVYYSTNSGTFSYGANGSKTALALFECVKDGQEASYIKSNKFDENKEYVLIADKNKALTNKNITLHASNDRMLALEVEVKEDASGNVTLEVPEEEDKEQNGEQDDPVKYGKKSFTSLFMGSMRYYNNSIDGWVHENNSKVVQAMMVYVYADRIVFSMKNYGTQDAGSWDIEPYTVYMKVKDLPTPEPDDSNDSTVPDAPVTTAPVTTVPTEAPMITAPVNPVIETPEPVSVIARTNIKSVKINKKLKKAVITVKKIPGIKGYRVLVSTNRKFKGKSVKSVYSKGNTITISKLKVKKNYYIKACGYNNINGKKVFGRFSAVKKLKVK